MTDIVAFIRARLDDDERIARGATSGGPWRVHGMAVRGLQSDGTDVMVIRHTWPQEAEHIVRHDPARVLREVAAKRRVLARFDRARDYAQQTYSAIPALGFYRHLFADLASVWSDHPDYDPSWTVET